MESHKKPTEATASREELERRKAELEYLACMAAAEGCPLSKAEEEEYLRLKKALADKAPTARR
jgi:hypothetical protein